jgi:hypothetical protein
MPHGRSSGDGQRLIKSKPIKVGVTLILRPGWCQAEEPNLGTNPPAGTSDKRLT